MLYSLIPNVNHVCITRVAKGGKNTKDIVAGMMVAPAASSEVQHGEVVSPPAEMVWIQAQICSHVNILNINTYFILKC